MAPFAVYGAIAIRLDAVSSITRMPDGFDWIVVIDGQVRYLKPEHGRDLADRLGFVFWDEVHG